MMVSQRLQHVSSGALALLVHGLLLLGLMVGVSWKNPPQLPVEADLWSELPELPPLAPDFEPLLETPPGPLLEPPLPSASVPGPKLKPEPEPAPPAEADIALEKAEKKRLEEQRRQEVSQLEAQQKLEKKLAEEKHLEEKRLEEKRVEGERLAEQQRVESERLEKERVEKEKQAQNRRQLEQDLARQMREAMDVENAQQAALQNQARQARASAQARTVNDFKERIATKIRNALVMPQNLRGDAAVEYQVNLLPNGEVLRVDLVKTSGQPLYDLAVERAIRKAEPFPLPSDRETARQFREGLRLKFRPSETAVNYRP